MTPCGEMDHDWKDNPLFGNDDSPDDIRKSDFVCKVCGTLGTSCPVCRGEGTIYFGDEGSVLCDLCDGDGIVPSDKAKAFNRDF